MFGQACEALHVLSWCTVIKFPIQYIYVCVLKKNTTKQKTIYVFLCIGSVSADTKPRISLSEKEGPSPAPALTACLPRGPMRSLGGQYTKLTSGGDMKKETSAASGGRNTGLHLNLSVCAPRIQYSQEVLGVRLTLH